MESTRTFPTKLAWLCQLQILYKAIKIGLVMKLNSITLSMVEPLASSSQS